MVIFIPSSFEFKGVCMTKYLACIQVDDEGFSGLALIDCRSKAVYSGGGLIKDRVYIGNTNKMIKTDSISPIVLSEEKFYEILNESFDDIKKDFKAWFKKHKFDELLNAV